MAGFIQSILQRLLHGIDRIRFRRNLEQALALNHRGEVRPDGLLLKDSRNHLAIVWQARLIHPWDQDLPEAQKASSFVEQCLADTDAAVSRLFERLPSVDVIEVSVLEPSSQCTIIAGTVSRWEFEQLASLSPGMRLKQMGMSYRITGSQFETLGSYAGLGEALSGVSPSMDSRSNADGSDQAPHSAAFH
jgi:hypothetical protein